MNPQQPTRLPRVHSSSYNGVRVLPRARFSSVTEYPDFIDYQLDGTSENIEDLLICIKASEYNYSQLQCSRKHGLQGGI